MQARRAVLLIAISSPAIASSQSRIVLTKADAEFPEPFSVITGVRELMDGRVLVADSRNRIVQLIGFNGRAVNVGREGTGPGEFIFPSRLIALPGDTSAIYDPQGARFLIVHPDGRPGMHFRIEGSDGRVAGRTPPRGVDMRGRIYFQGPALARNSAGAMIPAESAAVLRFDRSTKRSDTIAFVQLAKGHTTISAGRGGGALVSTGMGNPLVPRDEWAVLPDGRVAVVHAEPYMVEFFTSRSVRTTGPVVPYEMVKVDHRVRQMVEEERLRVWRRAASGGRGRGDGSANTSSGIPPNPPPLGDDWPAFMPPFVAQAAEARPNGDLWVKRTQKVGNAEPLYDVFDGTGRVIGQVVLPAKTTLIGFGRESVYLIRYDQDDLQYLQRYRLPN